MTQGGRRANAVVALAAVVVTAALVVLGIELGRTQATARQTLVARFHDRAQVVSSLIQAELASVATSTASTPAYEAPHLSVRALDRSAAQGHLAYVVVLGPGRHVIAASSNLTPADRARVLSSPALASVLAGAPVAGSDALPGRPAGGGALDLVVPLRTSAGPRAVVDGVTTPLVSAFLSSYLAQLPTPGGAAYVLDSHNQVLGSSTPALLSAQPVGDGALLAALGHRTGGPYGHGDYFQSAAVPDTTWRVVLTSKQSTLLSSVSGPRKWLPWAIYIALGLVALAFLAALGRALRSAAALSRANAQLAQNNARLQSTNALLQRAAELSRSNAELEQFASIASHDLQEPLRKVQTFGAQLMATEHDRLSERGQDFLRRMSDAAGRMRALIDDLLMFSRVTTEGRPFTPVNLGDVLAQVLNDLEVSIAEAGAHVTVGELPLLEADPLQMRQLLQNLLTNALKFRREGVPLHIRVCSRAVDGIAELTVQDNGIGFDQQYATRIFRAFERLHGSRVYPGTGIGLALCRKIVERHRGTITADAELGRGARFTVRLPLNQPEPPASPDLPLDDLIDQEVPHVPA